MGRKPRKCFETLYEPEPNTGCWLWTGALGGTQQEGQTPYYNGIPARWTAIRLAGGRIRKHRYITARCGNGFCVNPDHAERGVRSRLYRPKAPRRMTAWEHRKPTQPGPLAASLRRGVLAYAVRLEQSYHATVQLPPVVLEPTAKRNSDLNRWIGWIARPFWRGRDRMPHPPKNGNEA